MTDTCDEGRRRQPRRQAVGTADPLRLTNLVLEHQQRQLVTQLSPAGAGSAGWQRQRQHHALAREIGEEPGKTRPSSAAPKKHREARTGNQDALCRLEEQPETPRMPGAGPATSRWVGTA